MARRARSSVEKPITVLMTRTAAMAMASIRSPRTKRHDSRDDQKQDDNAGELITQNPQCGCWSGRFKAIQAVLLEATSRFRFGEPSRARLQCGQDLVDGPRVIAKWRCAVSAP